MTHRLTPALAVASLLALGTAHAGSDTDTWYLAGKGVWVTPETKRNLDDGFGGQLSLGIVASPQWDVEFNAITSNHDRSSGTGASANLTGGGVDINRVFNRNNAVNPFVGLGFGYLAASSQAARDAGSYGAFGVGVIGDINRKAGNTSTLQWRLDAKLRHVLSNGQANGSTDIIVGVGLQLAFGRPQAAAALPPPPPPPPPPVAAPRAVAPPPAPPADSDKDGVPDPRDRCPNTPAGDKVDENGCSLRVTLKVFFDFDSAKLMPESAIDLDKLVSYLKDSPNAVGVIEGHTDSTGQAGHNLKLSQRRAEAVKKYVADKGINPQRLETKGYGETMPATSNDTKEGRAENRRAIFQRTDVK